MCPFYCSVVLTVLAAWRITLWLYPPEQASLANGNEFFRAELAKMGPWSWLETKAALLIGAAILLWVTDFAHHLPPAMIALGVGLFALLPPVEIDGRHYFDGGLVDSIPVGRAVALGASVVYVLHVGRIESPLPVPTRPWEVGLVSFEIARRHRFHEEMSALPRSTGFGPNAPNRQR